MDVHFTSQPEAVRSVRPSLPLRRRERSGAWRRARWARLRQPFRADPLAGRRTVPSHQVHHPAL